MTELCADILLVIGVLAFAVTSLGLLVARDAFDQIHYLAPSTLIGSVAICLAVLLHTGFSQAGSKAILIALLLLFSNPVLSHATARAARIRRKQTLAVKDGENIRMTDKQE